MSEQAISEVQSPFDGQQGPPSLDFDVVEELKVASATGSKGSGIDTVASLGLPAADSLLPGPTQVDHAIEVASVSDGQQAAALMDSQGPNAPGASSVTIEARQILNRSPDEATRQAFTDASQYYMARWANGVNGRILYIEADSNNDGRAD